MDASLLAIPTCYATVSIGTPEHNLNHKLEAIASAGFQGIELGFPDLLSFASRYFHKQIQPQDFDALCRAGSEIKITCEKLGLKIVMLQPFSNFEGWKAQSQERDDAFRRARGWIRIMQAVGTDMLQVGKMGDSENGLDSCEILYSRLGPRIAPTSHLHGTYSRPISEN